MSDEPENRGTEPLMGKFEPEEKSNESFPVLG